MISGLVKEIYEEIIELRRDIHAHPEVGMETVETANKICAKLDKYNIPYKRTNNNGVIAEVEGKKSNKIVMLRGDSDALNQNEKTSLPFASVYEGKMHACGHDFHTSMLVGSAIVLNKMKDEFEGKVRFIFQPGEEIADGAKHMIENGAMEDVDMGLGIHLDPLAKVGEISARRGADWAAVDHFYITISGKGAHGATPQDGIDALICAASIVTNIQTIVSREIDPMKPLVVTIGKLHSGTSFNIIAEKAELEGTCRSFDLDIYNALPSSFERIIKNIASAYNCEAEIVFNRVAKPLINNDEAYDILEKAIDKVGLSFFEAKQAMIGEDFSEYCDYAPCVFAHLGSEGGHPLHSPFVNFKEETIIKGIELEVEFALEALNSINK